MDEFDPRPSRRDLLRALTAAPVVAVVSPASDALAVLHTQYEDQPATLARTREGRSLSRFRYHNAESFLWGLNQGICGNDVGEMLYRSGIVVQLGLSSYLLDIGFSDEWNARHIRLDVAKSLAYANATGFGHGCPDMARLAAVLSPYWKWGHAHRFEARPDDGGFTTSKVAPLLRTLLDHVHDVTGHRRPNGWRREQREVQA
ncbi:hypothetical protein A0J57_05585 [Sphingobium sp. 22B]|uniref:twin-arginine translocation signal domain-containing protein n=1 Tax=Sphingobium TaxID=165695 RepID=UPI000783EDA7|nr:MULTISPECIES: twin-arginine translocation signal domain-containing protein [Sphingobium]OAP32385.1 hypothetical protein A8O16_07700 [Sphingobium sp. 20006FA]KXU33369.1 hypothetical protein AXW74_01905 [Sphingobium sp. AM]KYC33200.1 hypothetical protein A0J57_05585 [Sphingobium sp. 22B]MCB4863087.1 twin-arginine translocation signal domain-containing protein [Sphingobium sp. PNB]MEC6701471.1 twin-arginine translocation signal domain-containing protein [Sphingobium sp. SJ10-10]